MIWFYNTELKYNQVMGLIRTKNNSLIYLFILITSLFVVNLDTCSDPIIKINLRINHPINADFEVIDKVFRGAKITFHKNFTTEPDSLTVGKHEFERSVKGENFYTQYTHPFNINQNINKPEDLNIQNPEDITITLISNKNSLYAFCESGKPRRENEELVCEFELVKIWKTTLFFHGKAKIEMKDPIFIIENSCLNNGADDLKGSVKEGFTSKGIDNNGKLTFEYGFEITNFKDWLTEYKCISSQKLRKTFNLQRIEQEFLAANNIPHLQIVDLEDDYLIIPKKEENKLEPKFQRTDGNNEGLSQAQQKKANELAKNYLSSIGFNITIKK